MSQTSRGKMFKFSLLWVKEDIGHQYRYFTVTKIRIRKPCEQFQVHKFDNIGKKILSKIQPINSSNWQKKIIANVNRLYLLSKLNLWLETFNKGDSRTWCFHCKFYNYVKKNKANFIQMFWTVAEEGTFLNVFYVVSITQVYSFFIATITNCTDAMPGNNTHLLSYTYVD